MSKNGCEMMKCTSFIENKCHYEGEVCKYQQTDKDEQIASLRARLTEYEEHTGTLTLEQGYNELKDSWLAAEAEVKGLKSKVACLQVQLAKRSGKISKREALVIGANRMAVAIDRLVEGGRLDARSEVADARLDYGEPFKVRDKITSLQTALNEKEKALIDKTTDFSAATAEVLKLKKRIEELEAQENFPA